MGFSREAYSQAWETLDRRRQESQEESRRRRAEIYAKLPAVEGIEKELSGTGLRLARLILSKPERAQELVERLKEENQRLQRRRGALLESAGYPPDYLQELHYCPDCLDRGYIGPHRCRCMEQLLRRSAFRSLSEKAPVEKFRFDNFSVDLYPNEPIDNTGIIPRRRMGEILTLCKGFVKDFSKSSPSLLLLGPTGLGKTHLSLAIAGGIAEKGFGVVYISVQKLMDKLEAERFSRDGDTRDQYTDTIQSLLDCELLILDDLGAEFITQFTNSVLYNVINSRGMEDKPTIISTNLELSAIETRYTQRILSRLVCGYTVLKFAGKDIRFVQKSGSQNTNKSNC
ncbi:ATP-binding protein [Oscillospiraceae bacterium MB08-C2-2]|nr:ATP-binding protein [Oscillospiraceae bacterium MB08-C2-2]